MPNEETQQEERQPNGHDARRTVVRAAALAAASGATALAAKKALSHDSSSDSDEEQQGRRQRSGGDTSVVSTMAGTAWSSARDSLVPMLEDAAGQAGEYLAKNGPDVVRENIVPRFIRGFQNASKSSANDDDE